MTTSLHPGWTFHEAREPYRNHCGGHDGKDSINGRSRADDLGGGSGNDVLRGGTEDDVVTDGAGNWDVDRACDGHGEDFVKVADDDPEDTIWLAEDSYDDFERADPNDAIEFYEGTCPVSPVWSDMD